MARPLECSSDWVALAGDEQAKGTCTCPAQEEELALRDDDNERLDCGGLRCLRDGLLRWSLRDGQQWEERCGLEVNHIIVLVVCDAEITATPPRQIHARWEWDVLVR